MAKNKRSQRASNYSKESELTVDNSDRIAIKNCIKLLLDKEWHDIYDFHKQYRLLPNKIYNVITFLESKKLIDLSDNKVRLSKDINNGQVAIINKIMKNRTPDVLLESELV